VRERLLLGVCMCTRARAYLGCVYVYSLMCICIVCCSVLQCVAMWAYGGACVYTCMCACVSVSVSVSVSVYCINMYVFVLCMY